MTRYIHPELSRHTIYSEARLYPIQGSCCSLIKSQVAVCVTTLLQTGFSMSHTAPQCHTVSGISY